MKVPDGLEALNFTQDDVHTLVQGALPQVWHSAVQLRFTPVNNYYRNGGTLRLKN